MNEQTVDLYEQASLFASEEENPTKSYKDRVMLKFAELIVRDSASIADTAEPFLSSDLIKQHFGLDQ